MCTGASAPGRALARRLAGLLTGEGAERVPPFGMVADADDGLVVFVYGPVTVEAKGTDPIRLSGDEAATWVDRVIETDIEWLSLAGPGGGEPGRGLAFELGMGIVPGAGVSLTPTGAPVATAPPPPPAPPQAEVAPAEPATPPSGVPVAATTAPDAVAAEAAPPVEAFASISFAEPEAEAEVEVEERAPLPVEAAGEAAVADAEVEAEAVGELVQGIVCSRSHFNAPDASYCSSCGISMVHLTHNLVTQPRPPLGFLVFDDGSTFSLDGRYVLGREPEHDALVQSGEARPICLDDRQLSVSRVHAEIRLKEWDVVLADRNSTNGTFVWEAARNEWARVTPEVPVALTPGARAAVGQRTFIYETPHRQE